MKKLVLAAALALAATALALLAGGAAATGPAGTWQLVPAQSDTTGTPSTTATYKTSVLQPINADGSSVFSAKRGVVPVQFSVQAGTKTTTTHTIGPVVFQSIGSDGFTGSATDDYSLLVFTPSQAMTFDDIQSLVANYAFTTGDCFGGSLRWTINVQHNGAGQNVHDYYGDPGGVQSCTGTADESGDNLIASGAANRFEIEGGWPTAGGLYRSYADAQAVVGSDAVNWIALILDSGWSSDQVIDGATLGASINGNAWQPKTPGDTTDTTYGTFAPTCTLPAAAITLNRTAGGTIGAVDEVSSVSAADTTGFFRQVDCKYIYNLSVSGLGVGTYSVAAKVDGTTLDNPAIFGLK